MKKKLVINSTWGGCHIRGTLRMPLSEVIEKYCVEKIDKSKVDPLLSLSPDGDELIAKVIPLLEEDIAVLDDITVNSRKGLATCHGLKALMGRRNYRGLLNKKKEGKLDSLLNEARRETAGNFAETNRLFFKKAIASFGKSKLRNTLVLTDKNFRYSSAAQLASAKNPLVSVAIYGASRAIQSRNLKVKETLTHFLRNNKDALIRIERNVLILRTAKNAAGSLRKSYKETLELLKKYDETKDDSLLVSNEIEPINLDDAEEYFAAGNWAHPLLDATKILANLDYSFDSLEYKKAKKIYTKAERMRDKAIQKAKADEAENLDRETRLIQYNDLIEKSKETGRKDGKFDEALKMLKKAAKLMPEETEARWGVATALHHAGRIRESLTEYRELIKDFPDNHVFKFEYGQVLLRNEEMQEGLKVIGEVMAETDEFDNFLARLGEIYQYIEKPKTALIAYTSYLEKYPYDYKIWAKKGDCLTALGRVVKAEAAYVKAEAILLD